MNHERHTYQSPEGDGAVGSPAAGAAPAAPPAAVPTPNDAGGGAGEGTSGSGGPTDAAQHQGNGTGAPQPAAAGQPGDAGNWKDSLSEDLRAAPALRDIDSVEGLAAQLVNAQGLIGNSIRIPSEHASDAEKAAFRDKLREQVPNLVEVSQDPDAFSAAMRNFGAPEAADGYQLPQFEGENLKPVAGFNEWAHEANLTQAQFETVATRFTQAQQAAAEQAAVQHNSDMELLHREWGYAYEERSQLALDMARASGAPADFVAAMERNAVPAAWVKYMADMGKAYGAEADLGSERGEGRTEMTPQEAQSQYDEVMNNKEHAYWTSMPGSEEGARARELVMKLKERAMGRGARDTAATFGYDRE